MIESKILKKYIVLDNTHICVCVYINISVYIFFFLNNSYSNLYSKNIFYIKNI